MLNTFVKYISGDITAKALGVVSVPVYTYLISPKEYGVYSIVLSYVAIATFLFSLNVHTSISRFFYEKDIDLGRFLSTTFVLTSMILFVSFSIFFLLDDLFLDSILGVGFSKYKIYFSLLVVASIIFSIYLQILIPQSKGKEYSFLVVAQAYLKFILTVIFLYFIEATVLRFLQAILLADIFISLYIVWKLKVYATLKFSKSDAKYILSYSVFLIPYMLSSVVLAQIDRVMIGNMIGEVDAGIYSVAYVFGSIPLMMYAALSNAWMPRYFANMNEKSYVSLDKDVRQITSILVLGIIGFAVFIPLLLGLMLSEDYKISILYVPLVSLSMFFAMLWNVFGRGISFAKKTVWMSIAGIISAIVNVGLNYIWIPKYGLMGAVYATYISYLVMALLGYLFAKYLLGIYTTSIMQLKWSILGIFFISSIIIYFGSVALMIMQFVFPLFLIALYFKNKHTVDNLMKRIMNK